MKRRWILVAGLAPMILAVMGVPELWLDPSARCWANPQADGLGASWTLWFVSERLLAGEWLGSPTIMTGFPEGGRIWPMHPVQGVLLTPLSVTLGAPLVANLSALLHLGLSGALMAACLGRLKISPLAAVLASPVLSLSPVLLSSIRNGNLEVSAVFWLPLCLLLALRLEERPSWGRRAGLGLGLALALVDSTYMGTSAFILVSTWMLRAGSWKLWVQASAVCAGLAGPVLFSAAEATLGSAALVERSQEVVQKMRLKGGAVSLEQWFQPGLQVSEHPSGGVGHYLIGAGPGLILMSSVVIWGLWCWRAGRRPRRVWWVLGALGVSLAMGPILLVGGDTVALGDRSLPLPMVLWDRAPPFRMLTELWRFSVLLHLVLAVGLASLLDRLLQARKAFGLILGIGVLIEAVSLGSGGAVWQSHPLPERDVSALLEGKEPGAVVDLPLRQGRWPLYFQTQHGRPIGNSVAMASVPQLFGLVSSPGWTLESFADRARGLGFRWLVIHDTESLRALQPLQAITQDLEKSDRIAGRGPGLVLVDLSQEGSWPQRPYSGAEARDLGHQP